MLISDRDLLLQWWTPMPTARRSGLPYIKHIDDGLTILKNLTTDVLILQAYTLHPIIQSDVDYVEGSKFLVEAGVHPIVLMLLGEYRKTANAYLPRDPPRLPAISPDRRVNLMLYVDKIQNMSDVCQYNKDIKDLPHYLEYFTNWLKALGTP